MRITIKDLEVGIDRLNRTAGTPDTPYTKTKDGKFKPNAGNYHLSGAYGGYQVTQMVESGGCCCPIGGGHVSKRECYETLHAFIKGIEAVQHCKADMIANYRRDFPAQAKLTDAQ